jgi:hypothetical protein
VDPAAPPADAGPLLALLLRLLRNDRQADRPHAPADNDKMDTEDGN